MIGYASSADSDGNWRNIEITILNADDFEIAAYGCDRQVYCVDRFEGTICHTFNDGNGEYVKEAVLFKIINALKLRELRLNMAVCIAWRTFGDDGIEVETCEINEKVWLPIPLTNDTCKGLCINITRRFFDAVPKPLETSFVCDILNILVLESGIAVSNPFYCCFNSIFCNAEFMWVLRSLFGKDFLSTKSMKKIDECLKKDKLLKKVPKTRFSVKRVISQLGQIHIPSTRYDGTDHYFVVGLKRDCLSAVTNDTHRCLEKGFGIDWLFRRVAKHIREALVRIRTLGKILVIKEHVVSIGDINYLTYHEILEAFSFQENALELKTVVRESQKRQRILNALNIPDYI